MYWLLLKDIDQCPSAWTSPHSGLSLLNLQAQWIHVSPDISVFWHLGSTFMCFLFPRSLSRIIPLLPLLCKPLSHCSLQQWDQCFHHQSRQHSHLRSGEAAVPLANHSSLRRAIHTHHNELIFLLCGCRKSERGQRWGFFEGNRLNWNGVRGAPAQKRTLFFAVKGHRRHPEEWSVMCSHLQLERSTYIKYSQSMFIIEV